MPHRPSIRRPAYAVTAAVLAATGLAATAAPTAATPAGGAPAPSFRPAARVAAGWLARHLTGAHHDHYVERYQGKAYADYGDTADGVMAMAAAKVGRADQGRATRWLAGHVAGYADADCGAHAPKDAAFYPGSLGKLLLVAETEHRNARSFGGLNLARRLVAEESAQAGQKGLYGASCDYASPITQSLALIGLAHDRGHAPDAAASGWLASQQCGDGGFTDSVRTGKKCPSGSEDVDTTAYAAQALAVTRGATASATRAADRWLLRNQHRDGGFGTAPTGQNTNSTAIAVQALLARHGKAAAAGQTYLAHRQERCSAAPGRRGSLDFQHGYAGASSQLVATAQGTQALASGVLGRIDRHGSSGARPGVRC